MGFETLVRGSVNLPIPDVLVKGLHLGTLVLHLAVMTLFLGLTLFYLRETLFKDGGEGAPPKLPVWMAFVINTGVAPLLFSQALYADFIYSSSILMAGWWLGMLVLLMVAYALSYVATSTARSRKARQMATVILSVLVLFVSTVLISNIYLMNHPGLWQRFSGNIHGWVFAPGGLHLLFKWGHVVLAAMLHAFLFRRIFTKEEGRGGGLFFGGAIALTAITGVGLFFFWPQGSRPELVSGISALWLPIASTGVLWGAVLARQYRTAGIWAVINLGIMVGVSEAARFNVIQPAIRMGTMDYGSLVMFAISLLVGGGALFWMLRLPVRGDDA